MAYVAFHLIFLLLATQIMAEEFSCPESGNCTCTQITGREKTLRLFCPLNEDDHINIIVNSKGSTKVICSRNIDLAGLDTLNGVVLPRNQFLEIKRCYLPREALVRELHFLDARAVIKFTYVSDRDLTNDLNSEYLRGLENVKHLDFANDGIRTIPPDFFVYTGHLERVNFRNNLLVKVPENIFQGISAGIKNIDLGNNHINELPRNVFKNMTGLLSLSLNDNYLESIPSGVFEDLVSMRQLDLRNNALQFLPANTFENLLSLEMINLDRNNFKSLSIHTFSRNAKLTKVHLSDNARSELVLPEGVFANLTFLRNLEMGNSSIKSIPENTFWKTENITSINLTKNKITIIPINTFQHCKNLLSLDLSFNKLTTISSDALRGLQRLEVLNLKNNLLLRIEPLAWTPNLIRIVLANNRLNFKDENTLDEPPLKYCKLLKHIDLSNNSLTEISVDWMQLKHLEVLKLSNNNINTSIWTAFHSKRIVIDVTYNCLELFDIRDISANITWLIGGNPILCSCIQEDFFRLLKIKAESGLEFDTEGAACSSPAALAGRPVSDVRPEEVMCPVDCAAAAAPCSCHFRSHDAVLVVDCGGRNMTEAPSELPTRPDARRTELLLSRNQLTSPPDFTGPGYEQVAELSLSHNRLRSLVGWGKGLPDSLRVLRLDHNELSSIDSNVLVHLSNTINLTVELHDNPWKCNCELQPFVSFIQSNWIKISERQFIICEDGTAIYRISEELCWSNGWAFLAIPATLVLLLGVLMALYFRFTHEVKAWLYAHSLCLWCVTEQELDKSLEYDVFVSFSHKDEDFVVNVLVPGLEGGDRPLTLCLHYRDFVPGESIASQIARDVARSRRTLVVLSENFLESEWGRYEFRTAHCKALGERRARVVVVLLGDIGPVERLDPELRGYLSMNTFVKWGDPWFWNKLRYALPHCGTRCTEGVALRLHHAVAVNPGEINSACHDVDN